MQYLNSLAPLCVNVKPINRQPYVLLFSLPNLIALLSLYSLVFSLTLHLILNIDF